MSKTWTRLLGSFRSCWVPFSLLLRPTRHLTMNNTLGPLGCKNWNGQNQEFNDRDRRKQ